MISGWWLVAGGWGRHAHQPYKVPERAKGITFPVYQSRFTNHFIRQIEFKNFLVVG
jgi:hypothetical protein